MTDSLDYLGQRFHSCWHFALEFYGVKDTQDFLPISDPQDGDYFLVNRAGRVYHCGIVHEGGYLHQMSPQQGVVYTRESFPDVSYYRAPAAVRHGPDQ